MSKVFIFDVDGTLTPSRRTMTPEFEEFFYQWSRGKKYYLVSGSDLVKMKEQVGVLYLSRANGIFCCGGNQFYDQPGEKLIYENKFKPPETLLTYLGFQTKISDTPVKSTNHREDRGSMLNFSVVGRDCTQEQRDEYFEWDTKTGERKKIAKEIMDGWPELDAVIGGQISIDIVPKGYDKSQVLPHIEKRENADEYIFVGDRIEEGGNDYPLGKILEDREDGVIYKTTDWKETMKFLGENYG
tara:strand:+ start:514 stop:1239 length:726 start_codon:yes stop_codon:yes gene_type:complete